ncbi:MAG: acetyl-CoA acetyltransferase [Myxococcota bacterium]
MTQPIFILGGAQSDFSRNWSRDGKGIFDLIRETFLDGLEATQLDASEVETVHVGNFVGELFCGQGLLGGLLPHVHPGLDGVPSMRHEAACASGSMAALAAGAELEAGRYGLAAVLGVEMMRNVPGETAAEHLGAAAWVGREARDATYLWPAMFSQLAETYAERYGLDEAHLGAISRKNFDNAKRNPAAQTRRWTFDEGFFARDDITNPVIEGRMRKSDCGQVTDGAAVVFLASSSIAEAYARRRGLSLEDIPRIKGWGHRTAPLLFQTKLDRSGEGYLFPWVRRAIEDAYARAEIPGPEALDAIETHDCFSITEYMALEHFGLTPPGEGFRAVDERRTELGGATPVNPSGGLIGLGHPVGATGVRMLLDAFRQTAGRAGDYQVDGARTVATYNVGGSTTANACFVVGT